MKTVDVKKEIAQLSNPKRAKQSIKFFKSGKGEYGEGDIFVGLTVPEMRIVAKEYYALPITEISKLLKSKIHEERLVALLILVQQFLRGNESIKKEIYQFYLDHTKYINNWDLVDLSSYHIVGGYLLNKSKAPLLKLAKSKSLWEKRISIVSTYEFIKNNDLDTTYSISEILLGDSHDLIHKAVGWMLREAGKRDVTRLKKFLKEHYQNLSRTSLRYAIEKLPEEIRQRYLKGEI